jgi:methyl-accepting chemotaxis protein
MTEWQDHPAETRAALAAVSQGSCYFPGCGTPVVVVLGDRPVVNVEIARISESEAGRSRYVAGLSAARSNSFDNLLLLCVPHRKTIDRDVRSHPIDLLETWKVDREAGHRGALSRLQNIDDERIDELLATAFSAVRDQIADALARFEKADADAARLIRQFVDGLSDQRRHAPGHETAVLAAQATDRLGVLADRLLDAAGELRSLGHTVRTIDDASNRLTAAAEALERLADQTTRAEPPKRTNIGWT